MSILACSCASCQLGTDGAKKLKQEVFGPNLKNVAVSMDGIINFNAILYLL